VAFDGEDEFFCVLVGDEDFYLNYLKEVYVDFLVVAE